MQFSLLRRAARSARCAAISRAWRQRPCSGPSFPWARSSSISSAASSSQRVRFPAFRAARGIHSSGLLRRAHHVFHLFSGQFPAFSAGLCAQSCRQRAFEHGARARSRGARSVALQRGVAAEADGNPARGVFPAEERRKRAVGDTRNINNNPMNAGKETCRSLQDR